MSWIISRSNTKSRRIPGALASRLTAFPFGLVSLRRLCRSACTPHSLASGALSVGRHRTLTLAAGGRIPGALASRLTAFPFGLVSLRRLCRSACTPHSLASGALSVGRHRTLRLEAPSRRRRAVGSRAPAPSPRRRAVGRRGASGASPRRRAAATSCSTRRPGSVG